MRILAAARLSRDSGRSTSIETQGEGLEDWAKRGGHTVVKLTSDLDISGGLPIRERPEIGPYLTPDHLGEWDAIAGYKLDRLFRNHYDYVTFYHEICQKYGKVIISTSEGIDTSTPVGRMIASILVQFAEWELTTMTGRRRDAGFTLRANAWWNGGHVPFGYKPLKVMGFDGQSHYEFTPEPLTAWIVNRMAALIIAGQTRTQVADYLNQHHVPGPHKTKTKHKIWDHNNVTSVLTNISLNGYVIHDYFTEDPSGELSSSGKPKRIHHRDIVRDELGVPVRREPVIDDDTWAQLQEALTATAQPKAGTSKYPPSLLLGAIWCTNPLHDPQKMYRHGRSEKRATEGWYACNSRIVKNMASCDTPYFPLPEMEAAVTEILLDYLGKLPMRIRKLHPGSDNQKRIAELDEAKEFWIARAAAEPSMADVAYEILKRQAEERDHLALVPIVPASVTWDTTGQTFGQHWEALDVQGRNLLLARSGVLISAGPPLASVAPLPMDAATLQDHLLPGLTIAGWPVTVDLGSLAALRELLTDSKII